MTILRKAMLLAFCSFLSAPGVAMMTDEDSEDTRSRPPAPATAQEMVKRLRNREEGPRFAADLLAFHFQYNQNLGDPLLQSAKSFLRLEREDMEVQKRAAEERMLTEEKLRAAAKDLLALGDELPTLPPYKPYDLKALAERVVTWVLSNPENNVLQLYRPLEDAFGTKVFLAMNDEDEKSVGFGARIRLRGADNGDLKVPGWDTDFLPLYEEAFRARQVASSPDAGA